MKIVLDTCVLLSGIGVNGTERRILEYINRNQIQLVLSKELFVEYIYTPSKIVLKVIEEQGTQNQKKLLSRAYHLSNKIGEYIFEIYCRNIKVNRYLKKIQALISNKTKIGFKRVLREHIQLTCAIGICYYVLTEHEGRGKIEPYKRIQNAKKLVYLRSCERSKIYTGIYSKS